MQKKLLVIVVVLLAVVVGYLALDRQEKNAQQERAKAFNQKFAK